jgi:endonuclease YncB( thermonuclease family)
VTARGDRWACGQRAYLKLRNLIERRSIACQIKDVDKPGGTDAPRLAVCKVDRADVAISLLQDGLAELADGVIDKSYIAAASLAKNKKIGLWADVP